MTTRLRPPEQGDFTSRLHHRQVAARLGAWLGICFSSPSPPVSSAHRPAARQLAAERPVWGYRLPQGVHVAAGTACVPLLLAKRAEARGPRARRR